MHEKGKRGVEGRATLAPLSKTPGIPVRSTARLLLSLLCCAAVATAYAQAPSETGDGKNEGSYSLGVSIGAQLRGTGLSADAVAIDQVMRGLKDGLGGTAQATPEHGQKVNNLIQTARVQAGERNKATARKFLGENGKKKGVITTKSGLQYRVVAPGKGATPKPTDQVTVHYRGTLLDGTEFDSSYKRGEPATFPVDGVIPGWQEALVLMKPGAKFELVIPPELAYDMQSPPAIDRLARKKGARFEYLFMRASGAQLERIGALVDQGVIKPVLDRTFPLSAAAEAVAYVESGRAVGKVVIRVAD